ncbi:helix-turn-helix transcriptional regulator [Amnibacterium endophyticum]|uniref:Helix-turn-helix transcriptional regulator n=1 Tax=Amnibacterium endophyticum TaxID=2109337 RepID=A0ABW4LGI5_9MICO
MADAQPMRVQDRLTFLLALVPYLLDNDGVPVAQAAAHFGVGEQRIRDAVALIAVSGVPGETKTYQPNDLFDIDWDRFLQDDEIAITQQIAIDDSPRFSAREAAALIAGLQYVSALPENADREAVATLTAKLQRAASGAPAPVAVEGEADRRLGTVRDATAAGAVLVFDYVSGRGAREERSVEPLRVESVDESWYLRGWDRSRRALRTFRLDRMGDVRVDADATTERPDDLTLPDRIFQPSKQDLQVLIEVADGALPLLADYLGDRPQTEPGSRRGRVRTRLRIAHLEGLQRLVAQRAGLVEVVGPPEARRAVRDWARAGLDRYGA